MSTPRSEGESFKEYRFRCKTETMVDPMVKNGVTVVHGNPRNRKWRRKNGKSVL
jgi:hypothetical protein